MCEVISRQALSASDAQSSDGDRFGCEVDIEGDTLVVGACNESGGVGNPRFQAGAVYVFERNEGGENNWGETAILRASDAAEGDHFGMGLLLDGNTLIIGAVGEDGGGGNPVTDAGAVYIFERIPGEPDTWNEIAILHASDSQEYARFGYDLAVYGDTLAVGAFSKDVVIEDTLLDDAGSVYIFDRHEGGTNAWGETHILYASDPQSRAMFGYALALNNDTLLVGEPLKYWDDGTQTGTGTVSVFGRDYGEPEAWGNINILRASESDRFGWSLALQEQMLIVGDVGEGCATGAICGAVYLFEAGEDLAWHQITQVRASDAQPGARFGSRTAISGDTFVAAAYDKDVDTGEPYNDIVDAGGAYVFEIEEVFSDLILEKTVTPSIGIVGEPTLYELAISNIGQATAIGVVLTDTLPVSLTNVTVNSNLAITSVAESHYVWHVAELASGATGHITITGVFSDVLTGSIITNSATISATNDKVPSNNTSSVALRVVILDNFLYLPLIQQSAILPSLKTSPR